MADDVLAVLDALELERVRLVGHDCGAWIGFLACGSAPERFEAFLALGSPRPLGNPPLRQLLQIWRFAYQVVLAAPVLGRHLIANERLMQRVILAGAVHREAWTPDDLRAFTAVLAEPARARASVLLYRTFLVREAGRTPGGPLSVPTRMMVGASDPAIRPFLLEGAERDADDLVVEVVPDCGHFVPEERPQLVAERARALFGLR